MADISDVLNVLVGIAANAAYPNGTAQPSAAGVPVLAYVGWPDASTLDTDVAALNQGAAGGRVHVSVYPRTDEQRTTRYARDWRMLSEQAATLTLAVAGRQITLGGTVTTPQNLAVVAAGSTYTYAVQPSDTLESIATSLSALIPGSTSSGAQLTVPAGVIVRAARAGGSGQMLRELRRQTRTVQVTVWANSPTNRDAVAPYIDAAYAGIDFITLPDQTSGRFLYRGSPMTDGLAKAQVYRRDLLYTVEYATTQLSTATAVVSAQAEVASDSAQGSLQP